MKKLVLALVAIAALALVVGNVNAEEKYVGGGFEASGHINTGFGFQYIGKNSANTGGSVSFNRDGWSNFQTGDKNKDFGFILDEVELDLMKTFGENIKFRTDLKFGDPAIGSHTNGIALEQAYVTANIAAGNGIELLFGRFDAPIGYEAVDRNDNNTITHSMLFNWSLRPRTLTGMKIYYAFSDAFDWHFYIVNNLMDDFANFNAQNNILPTFGTRVGYSWGEESKESVVGLSAAAGNQVNKGKKIGRMSFLGDLDWNIWLTDAFVLGGEGLFRMDDAAKGAKDAQYYGGIVDLHYVFSDVWDGTLKYALLYKNATTAADTSFLAGQADVATATWGMLYPTYGPKTGAKGLFHEISLAGAYHITDGAKFGAEYRLDWTKLSGLAKNMSHMVVGNFAYSF